MDERSAIAVMSGQRRDAVAQVLRGVCQFVSWGYTATMQLRNLAYDRGWLRVHSAGVPVISVGNLTTGGTGKTPVVAWLVQELQRRGRKPGILSRGYRSLNGQANDEALVLEELCPGVPHLQQRDRVASAARAVAEFGCDVLVLDDGFQHRRLHRDLDLLLVDALQPWGYGHVLPRGLLRESLSGMWRADLVLITRARPGSSLVDYPEIRQQLRQHRGTDAVALLQFAAAGWRRARAAETCGVEHAESSPAAPRERFPPQRLAAFCGIGNPESFFAAVAPHGELVGQRVFADHHHYTTGDLDELHRWQTEVGADALVTTLKDLVKIPREHPLAGQLWSLDIACDWIRGQSHLMEALDTLCPIEDLRHCSAA